MPRPRFANAELRDENIHVGIEFDKNLVRIVMLG